VAALIVLAIITAVLGAFAAACGVDSREAFTDYRDADTSPGKWRTI